VKYCRSNAFLLVGFMLVTILGLGLLGVFLGREIKTEFEDQIVNTTVLAAETVTQLAIEPAVIDALTGAKAPDAKHALDRLVAGTKARISNVTIRDHNGAVVYSLATPAASPAIAAAATRALAGAPHTVTESERLHVISALGLGPDVPRGTIDFELPQSVIAAHARNETRDVYRVLALGLGAVLLALLPLVAIATRRLRHQQADHAYEVRHDDATGLPNRAAFYERATTLLAGRGDAPSALILIDLDRFKEINDSLGHEAGDGVLKFVAARLRHALRDEDLIARLGGDEFAILVPSVPDAATAEVIAWKIRGKLDEQFLIQGIKLDVSASIGIALAPEHGDDIQTLMRQADVAMYAAKNARAGVNVYEAGEDPNSADQLGLIADLRTAVAECRLQLHYQPKALLENGYVEGVEALCRWIDPVRGFVSPGTFIPIAEQTGLIKPLTLWVVDEALRQAQEWRRRGIGLSIAVNISAQNLQDPNLTDDIAGLLAKWEADADWIVLEVTESAVMDDPELAIGRLDDLAGMGLQISIDDYGTGYSSLAYLKRLPISELKIDRSFVMNITSDQKDALIISSTVELGHNLGLRVVAEGVEREEDWIGLQMLGCDVAQGYFLGRPMSPGEITTWLEEPGRDYARVPVWSTDAA
jgi:diguanylate cyclase (GGDEF)-like protein